MNVRAIFNSLIGLQGSEHSTPIPGNFFLGIWILEISWPNWAAKTKIFGITKFKANSNNK